MRHASIVSMAALLLLVLFSAGPGFAEPAPEPRKPAIVLAPPPGQAVEPEAAPPGEAAVPARDPPPIARKKPPPPKKASPPRAPEKPAARKVPARKAPARAPASPAPQAKDCDYCYGCESLSLHCKRQWVCGARYTQRLAAGLCRR